MCDAVFEFVDALRKARAVLDDAVTDMIEVDAYETGGPTAYPARQYSVTIALMTLGDGGKPAEINFTIYYNGDATEEPSTLSTLCLHTVRIRSGYDHSKKTPDRVFPEHGNCWQPNLVADR
jgi:hypothetical protein